MDGILNIDKPEGLTSHDVVARVRRLLKEKRVGHTGTLDPFATGVLVLMVGRATRLAQFMATDVKEYIATVRFGYTTETGDLTGARLAPSESDDESEAQAAMAQPWSEARMEEALSALRGEIEQVPPMYSAKKIAGKKLYELARRGETVEREARRVTIYTLEAIGQEDGSLLHWNEDGTCDMAFRVSCSAGTYVRVLAESLGERLGVGAHLASLRRTRAGEFRIETAVTLDELATKAEEGNASNLLLSMNAALSSLSFLHLTAEEARRVGHGVPLSLKTRPETNYSEGERLRLIDTDGNLLAVGAYDSSQEVIRPIVVLA
ncbi:MAG TPA: tRNA pseudouridine(55) synthase TruB [Pyrinomonadaceae bacterium]|nr:tRNA pseudouridine(55) synthase TruB [Pyrinomonadaceae bacterium]